MGAQVVSIIIIILVVIIIMVAIGYNFWRKYFLEETRKNESNRQTDKKSSTLRSNIAQTSSTSSSDVKNAQVAKMKEPKKEEPKKMDIQLNQLVKQVPKQTKDKVVTSVSEKSKEKTLQPIETLMNESDDRDEDEDDEDWEKERDNISSSSDARSLKTITKNNDQLYKEEVDGEDGLANIGTIDFVSVHKNLPSFIPAPGQRYKGTRDSF